MTKLHAKLPSLKARKTAPLRVLALAALLALATQPEALAKTVTWDLTGLSNGGTVKTVTSDSFDLSVYSFGIVNNATAASNPFAVGAFRGGGFGLGSRFNNGNNIDNRGGDLDLLLLELPAAGAVPLQLGFRRADAGDEVRLYSGTGVSPSSFAGLSFNDLEALVTSGDLARADFSLSNSSGIFTVNLSDHFAPGETGRYVILTLPYTGSSDEFRLASVSAQVPEPASGALFLIALAGLAAVRRRIFAT